MYNHFRTTLLNLASQLPADLIPDEFGAAQLPAVMQAVHGLLFPVGSPRSYKLELVDLYLNIIRGAGRADALIAKDSRIIDVGGASTFRINRISAPNISDSGYPLFVTGSYKTYNHIYSDYLYIRQIGYTNNISIYSNGQGQFVTPTGFVNNEAGAYITLAKSGTMSQLVSLPAIGISLQFGISGTQLSDTSSKTWSFLAETTPDVDILTLVKALKASSAVTKMFSYRSDLDTSTYDNLWNQHPIPLYQLAGLLVGFTYRLATI